MRELSLLWHPLQFSWGRHPFLMSPGAKGDTIRDESSLLYPSLVALQSSPKPHRAAPPSVAALEFWDYRISLKDAASHLLLMHCRGSCIQTMNFQHTSFSCKPTSPEIASSFGGDAGRAPEVKS